MLKRPSHIIFCLVFFTIFVTCKQNENTKFSEVDALKNPAEVQNLIRKNFKNLKDYEVKKIQDFKRKDFACEANVNLANELGINESFYKTDFDNNSYTDLLVIGDDFSCFGGMDESCSYRPIVILNFGNKKYEVVNISQNFDDYFTPKIVKINGQNLLEIYTARIKSWDKKIVSKNPREQILAYKFGDFIEFNSNNQNYIPIQKIEFSTSGCYGTCPVFDLEINQNQEAKFIAKSFNFNKDYEKWSDKDEGRFQGRINDKDYSTLIKVLEYIDFPQLENNYAVNWTDDQTVKLKITYSSGKIKEISDYGASGTYGLKKVYKLLFDLRENKKWTKVDVK